MARKLRVEYPGAIDHLMNRGDRREPIFLDDADRQRLVETLAEACAKTGWQVHAYVLMPNHFHLVAETPQPNLVAGMKWFLGTYTRRFNRRHKLFGHLFSGRYGVERREMAEARAEQLLAAELKRRRWPEAELRTRSKGDAEKVALAARLRAETTMTVGWIAERLAMGTRGHLNHLLYRLWKSGG